MEQLISVPTRITESTATLIDHEIIQSGVIKMSSYDHALIYCTRTTTKLKSNEHNELNIRTVKNYTAENFIELLNKIELARNLVKKLPKPPLKLNTDKTMMFYKKLKPNLEKFELVYITKETIKTLLCCLDVSKAPAMDEIPLGF